VCVNMCVCVRVYSTAESCVCVYVHVCVCVYVGAYTQIYMYEWICRVLYDINSIFTFLKCSLFRDEECMFIKVCVECVYTNLHV